MKTLRNQKRRKQRGQSTILVVLALATFLLAFAGLATDYTNFWFTRQAAQGAADATCQAASMDMLLYAVGQQTAKMNFIPSISSSIQCTTTPTPAPCVIAKYNGFDGTTGGNATVAMSFPTSVPNPPAGGAPAGVSFPYVKVDVTKNEQAYFSRILTGRNTVAVHTSATCGLGAPAGPVPIVVLHPTMQYAINMGGNNDEIKVQGGPIRSIEVNSSNATAVYLATVDLSTAGPNNNGGDLAVWGGPATATGKNLSFGTGSWVYPASPIADPYRNIAAPSKPAKGTVDCGFNASYCDNKNNCSTNQTARGCYRVNGCPDPSGCAEYSPGSYTTGQGISVKNATAIFDPGLYWVQNGLTLDSNSTVRTSTATGDGSGGVMFYFSGSPSGKCSGTSNAAICINSNSGSGGNGNNAVDAYYVDGSSSPNGVPSRALKCPGGGNNPTGLPTTITGNVLLGPCPGTNGISVNYGDPSGMYRGFIWWQDRAAVGNAQWQGGGQSLVSGFMYFHQCNSDGSGTEPCPAPPSAFGDTFNLGGNPGSASYTLGSIVTDAIATNGTPNITMILNPFNSFPLLKVYLLE